MKLCEGRAGARHERETRRPTQVVNIEKSGRAMMADKIPHNALVVVADGTGARFFRNAGHGSKVRCQPKASLSPHLLDDGPAGKRPPESSTRRLTRPRSPNSWQKSSIAVPTAETSRRLSSSPIHRPWAKSARHCIRRFRIDWYPRSAKLLQGIHRGYSESVELVCPVAVLSRSQCQIKALAFGLIVERVALAN